MTNQTATRRKGFRVVNYVTEIINELKKVVWLTRRETAYLTMLVLIVTIIAGIVLGALDYGFTQLVNKVFAGG
jgi:preprotein translocase SecE subunit